jgi:6-phosphogluconolactonase (cycloisomerase 2 family)
LLAPVAEAGDRLVFVEALRQGIDGVDGIQTPWSAAVSPDGAHVYVAGWASYAIAVFRRDATSGTLEFVETKEDGVDGVEGLDEPTGVIVSPDGRNVYVTAYEDNSVVVFDRDASTGRLAFAQVFRAGVDGVHGLTGASSLTLSHDARYLYVTSELEGALVVFSRDPSTGLLTWLGRVKDGESGIDGMAGARSVAVSPDGRHLYVSGRWEPGPAIFERDQFNGALYFRGVPSGGPVQYEYASVLVSPDGKHVYVTTEYLGIALLHRDAVTGLLTFAGYQPIDLGVSEPFTMVQNADGTRIYISGVGDMQLESFRRDPITGALTVLDVARDGVDADGNRDGPDLALAVSPDGAHVYLGGGPYGYFGEPTDSSVTTFRQSITCAPAPSGGCRQTTVPGRAKLALRNGSEPRPDSLKFRWSKGQATDASSLGDPFLTADYALCVYDSPAGTPQLRLGPTLPPETDCAAAPCWTTTPIGFRYRSRSGAPEGLVSANLNTGDDGRATLVVAGKGAALSVESLGWTAPVIVEVHASTGACWEARFSTLATNDGTRLRATSD